VEATTMTAQRAILAALAVGVILGVAQPALATNGSYFWNYGCGPWGYFPPGGYYPERIPYYSLYPPVYYSHPVPRTYGYSPFAYPPGIFTPPSEYSGYSGYAEAAAPQTRPLRIANPYVARTEEAPAQVATDIPASPRPKSVFPARSE
jgi:hypothetical protein